MVFPDMQSILCLYALIAHTWAHDFGQTVDVDRVHVECALDLLAHGKGPRLGAEDAHLERRLAWIKALLAELIKDGEHVARGHHNDVRLEVADQLHLSLGHAA